MHGFQNRFAQIFVWLFAWQILCLCDQANCACLAMQVDNTQTASKSEVEKLTAEQLQFFESKIRPTLVDHCYECHAGSELSGKLSVESKRQLLRGGETGPALLSGERWQESLLLKAVSYQHENLQMPPSGKLSEQQIQWLKKWVSEGAPDPRNPSSDSSKSASSKPMGMSPEQGRQFWSFKPVARVQPPQVKNTEWIQTPVDQFVLSKLEQLQLLPAAPADKKMLIRRATLDLLGLPPSPEEIAEFVADTSPSAYRNLIERLLSSPQYGVRWGRHWLDVARYADSNGLDENIAFGNAWRYRDYVVHSFNQDKPFDQFIIEQVAGDLVPQANAETRTATGFLSLGAKVLAEPDVEKLVMDTIDEQLDTIGKSFLGLSLGCARCHDHKFDPITQKDYYALAAIFKGTRNFADERFGAIKYWYEHSLSTEAELESLKAVEKEIAAAKQAASKFKADAYEQIRQASRKRAADYLMAAAQLAKGASLVEVSKVAEPLGLHSRILHYCRIHVETSRDASFYQAWHKLVADPIQVQQHYTALFAKVDAAIEQAKSADPKSEVLGDPELEEARKERNNPAGFLAIPPQPEYALDENNLAEYYRLMEAARVIESAAMDRSGAMGVVDAVPVHELAVHIRGSHLNLGPLVPRNFPAVFQPGNAEANFAEPIFSEQSSGRMELARWLASSSNPLTSRVIVNRVWGWHFGRGLVASTEDFGAQGDLPSHPELLEWLARRLMQSGWSIKELHRTIMLSSTYQMSSTHLDKSTSEAIDAENRLLWKFPIQRLDAEQLRDCILASCGRLDLHLDGKSVPLRNRQFVFDHTSIDHTKYESLRRTLYLPIIRNNLYTLLEQFDYPDPTMPTGHRSQTIVAPQSLLLMNNDLVIDTSNQLASQLLQQWEQPDLRVKRLFLALLAREPTRAELNKSLDFIAQQLDAAKIDATRVSPERELQTWTALVQAVMATNDFLYVK